MGAKNGGNGGASLSTQSRTAVVRPTMYKVLMLNDDYTPMDFVIYALQRFFARDRDQATRITMEVHNRGVGLCGVFTRDVAETKVAQTMDHARRNQHPLQCVIEAQ